GVAVAMSSGGSGAESSEAAGGSGAAVCTESISWSCGSDGEADSSTSGGDKTGGSGGASLTGTGSVAGGAGASTLSPSKDSPPFSSEATGFCGSGSELVSKSRMMSLLCSPNRDGTPTDCASTTGSCPADTDSTDGVLEDCPLSPARCTAPGPTDERAPVVLTNGPSNWPITSGSGAGAAAWTVSAGAWAE